MGAPIVTVPYFVGWGIHQTGGSVIPAGMYASVVQKSDTHYPGEVQKYNVNNINPWFSRMRHHTL